jgi:hypothetical protein
MGVSTLFEEQVRPEVIKDLERVIDYFSDIDMAASTRVGINSDRMTHVTLTLPYDKNNPEKYLAIEDFNDVLNGLQSEGYRVLANDHEVDYERNWGRVITANALLKGETGMYIEIVYEGEDEPLKPDALILGDDHWGQIVRDSQIWSRIRDGNVVHSKEWGDSEIITRRKRSQTYEGEHWKVYRRMVPSKKHNGSTITLLPL